MRRFILAWERTDHVASTSHKPRFRHATVGSVVTVVALLASMMQDRAWAVVANYNPQTGNISFTGLAGEFGLSVFASESSLQKANALSAGTNAVDTTGPDVILYAYFAGFVGELNAGDIIVPLTPADELSIFWFDFNHWFDDPLPERSINIYEVAEPAITTLALVALEPFVVLRRRRQVRNRDGEERPCAQS